MNKDEERPFQHKEPKRKNYKERMREARKYNSLARSKGINRNGIRSNDSSKKPKLKSLRRVSEKQQKKLAAYSKSKPLNGKEECANCGATDFLEKHHPYGRGGDNITKWVYLCSEQGCGQHHWIHTHPNTAFQFGWLQPEYRGLDPDRFPNHPKPWE